LFTKKTFRIPNSVIPRQGSYGDLKFGKATSTVIEFSTMKGMDMGLAVWIDRRLGDSGGSGCYLIRLSPCSIKAVVINPFILLVRTEWPCISACPRQFIFPQRWQHILPPISSHACVENPACPAILNIKQSQVRGKLAMKRFIGLSLLIIMLIATTAIISESSALASAKKRTCSCKTTTRRKTSRATTAKRTPVANSVNNDATQANYNSAGVVGPVYATYTLPQNEYMRLRMNQTITSAIARTGDRFTATVITPVYANGIEVVPAGARVEGRVTSVVHAQTRGRQGKLALVFDTLVLPDGTKKQLNGDLADLQDEKGGEVDKENGVSGRSSDDRNVKYVGGGGIGGAILGGVIGGGKGAAIGGAIGAGAGVAGVMLTKGNEAVIKSGSEIGMVTTKPITFSVRADRER